MRETDRREIAPATRTFLERHVADFARRHKTAQRFRTSPQVIRQLELKGYDLNAVLADIGQERDRLIAEVDVK